MAQIYVGTSGFSYAEWKGTFYPKELKPKQFLTYYSEHFKTTEINNTFYRIPSENTAGNWADQVPKDFRFSLKLSQRITHKKRLRDVDEEMGWFLKGVSPLGDKLGCVLVQLPPWFRFDLEVLKGFLAGHAGKTLPLAFEFRHESWFCEEMYSLLRKYQCPLCVAESEKLEAVREVTASWLYLRLRQTPYTEERLSEWADWIKSQKRTAYVFLKHEQKAPEFAKALAGALGR